MRIDTLFIHREVAALPLTSEIRKRLACKTVWIDDPADINRVISKADDTHGHAKQNLLLTSNKGAFLKACPGTRNYQCCGYQILHVGTFCTMDCSYCILQAYFQPPVLQFFVNHDRLFKELEASFQSQAITRIGTGEFTDSMIWEKIFPFSEKLVKRFAQQERAVLELKTKTVWIDALEEIGHNRKTILSWSLNTERMIASQERGTASLDARLRAAATCQGWGYPLAFHFDPMFIYEGCETEYVAVLEKLFQKIDPANVVWISMGTFRFMPALKPIIEKRFPDSDIVYGEFILGLDGKMRYFKPLRMRLYKAMSAWFRKNTPDISVYFCMESNEVWQNCLGYTPDKRGGLCHVLDSSAIRHCRLTASSEPPVQKDSGDRIVIF